MITNLTSNKNLLLGALLLCLAVNFAFGQSGPSKVEVYQDSDGVWSLKVDGEPFYIKGAGGIEYLDEVVEMGGNTIRTWSADNATEILDAAHKRGLKVMMGLWVQHERHGFDYNNEEAVAAQLENFRQKIRKYKDHPALLIWCVGNEYELFYSNTKVWAAVNDIAKMVQEEDPNHPVSTVTAGTTAEKLQFVMKELTAIDIYGINTYADIGKVKDIIKDGNYKGPYMITEWGPTGHWESPHTKWKVAIEQTSKQKAASYLKRYKQFIEAERKQCIGSFAFLWGQKQEYTSTWYGLFTDNNMPTEALDELEYVWTGKYPENRSPTIDSVLLNGSTNIKNIVLPPLKKVELSLFASDKNKDKLNYSWELYAESTDKKAGGDAGGKPPSIPGRIKGKNKPNMTLKTPLAEGRYRIFIFVDDGKKVAYLNIPIYVESDPSISAKFVRLKKQTLQSFYEN